MEACSLLWPLLFLVLLLAGAFFSKYVLTALDNLLVGWILCAKLMEEQRSPTFSTGSSCAKRAQNDDG